MKARAGLQMLGVYFAEMLSNHMSAAGCNDTPHELFDALNAAEKEALLSDFEEWDRAHNPDGWEPKTILNIPDFAWSAYFMTRADEAIFGRTT